MVSVRLRAEPVAAARAPEVLGPARARTTVPTPPSDTVRRPELEARLDGAVSQRLTLVSAGPGWGKTTTVASWARAEGRTGPRVAWLTLEPVDSTPTAFWADVLAALRVAGAVPPGHPLDVVQVPPRISPDLLRRLLAAVDLLPVPVVLVLDDFHHVTDPEVLEGVDELLRYPLPLHLVVLTRLDPALGVQRLRGQGEVAELRVRELAFDAPTVTSLGARQGLSLGAGEVDRLLAVTGGWAVGVRLRLEATPDPADLARADRSAAEYLLSEVLDRLDPVARRFLLRTCVTSTVCAELAAALDPGAPAARLLDELAASNGFVTALDGQGTWYQYHPLLREMLQHQLRHEDAAGWRDAHRAAARWLARHGEPLRALEHAVESADWGLVGDVFVDAAAAHLVDPRRQAVTEALARVPYAALSLDVPLHLCAGALALATDRLDAAQHHVARTRELLAEQPDQPAAAVLLEVLDAATARAGGDVRRLASAGRAALAAADRVPFPFPALETYRGLAAADRRAGLAWCATAPQGVAAHAGAGGGEAGAGQELAALGARSVVALQAVASGRLRDGERLARGVLETAAARGWAAHVQTRGAHAALGWVRLLHADDDGASHRLALALAADSGGRDPAAAAAVHLLQGLLAVVHGRPRAARRALADAGRVLDPAPLPPLLGDLRARVATGQAVLDGEPLDGQVDDGPPCSPAVAEVCRARLMLGTGRASAAARMAAALQSAGEDGADAVTRVEAALVEASALARAGTRQADRAVERALDVAEPEQLALPFLTVATAELRPAVGRAVAHRPGTLGEVLRAHVPVGAGAAEAAEPVEPLTERELAVLAALPTMESNQEIAEDFVVSVNTVKAHLKALYRKLGVTTRRDAVRRGRELGLIP
ncbi:LuxR C-terminal-related transcriptional regulator [Puerhibacterium sp. TATVAM-FAB25]|uniref:helix-turn-helix transcriptional regulator n=1 Tax=Puerhibacterium sp. TATVAM-FAB25 TaxID=3093699 RepID=UPI0039780265